MPEVPMWICSPTRALKSGESPAGSSDGQAAKTAKEGAKYGKPEINPTAPCWLVQPQGDAQPEQARACIPLEIVSLQVIFKSSTMVFSCKQKGEFFSTSSDDLISMFLQEKTETN